MTALLLVHVAATWFMVGVIWFVQLVHYPLMNGVGRSGFVEYERDHVRRVSWVVLPGMLCEIATSFAPFLVTRSASGRFAAAVAAALLAGVWLSTFALQVPAHHRLGRGYDPVIVARLVRTNWLRTAAWSARAAIVTALVPVAVA